jgi:hypothetical protein
MLGSRRLSSHKAARRWQGSVRESLCSSAPVNYPRNIVLRTVPLQVAPDENASKAVDARQEIDLRIGAAFTRYQTLLLQVKLQSLTGAYKVHLTTSLR